jgi:hypothetical protein
MARIFLRILKCLPKTWASYLAKKFSTSFYSEERIVREIYDSHYNKKDKTLKSNFAAFRTIDGRKELSCLRFELESVENCRALGQAHATNAKTSFVGYACTKVSYIKLWDEYSLKFTPNLRDEPQSLFHVDIYDNSTNLIIPGEANPSHVNLQREVFKEVWKIHLDADEIQHSDIQPIMNLRDFIVYQNR